MMAACSDKRSKRAGLPTRRAGRRSPATAGDGALDGWPTAQARALEHANYRITLDMYVGSTAGVLDRARTATE
jgi:hypothetical protein